MPLDQLREESARFMQCLFDVGLTPPDKIPECVAEVLADRFDPAVVQHVSAQLLPQARAKWNKEMRSWPRVTDCDRLDAAFEELNALGIMARHDWQGGLDEVGDDYVELRGQWEGVPLTGYAFYTVKDAGIANLAGLLPMHIGAFDEDDDDDVHNAYRREVYVLICNVLMEHGLAFEWSGDPSRGAFVQMKWQRRAVPARFVDPRA